MKLAHSRVLGYSASTFFIVLFFSFPSFSQDITQTGLTWKVNSLIDQQSGQSITYSCTFQTNGTNDIGWIQKNGSFTSKLSVTGYTGTWTNIETPGRLIFQIQSEGESGTLEFVKNLDGTFVKLDLSQGNGNRMRYEFIVNEINRITP